MFSGVLFANGLRQGTLSSFITHFNQRLILWHGTCVSNFNATHKLFKISSCRSWNVGASTGQARPGMCRLASSLFLGKSLFYTSLQRFSRLSRNSLKGTEKDKGSAFVQISKTTIQRPPT